MRSFLICSISAFALVAMPAAVGAKTVEYPLGSPQVSKHLQTQASGHVFVLETDIHTDALYGMEIATGTKRLVFNARQRGEAILDATAKFGKVAIRTSKVLPGKGEFDEVYETNLWTMNADGSSPRLVMRATILDQFVGKDGRYCGDEIAVFEFESSHRIRVVSTRFGLRESAATCGDKPYARSKYSSSAATKLLSTHSGKTLARRTVTARGMNGVDGEKLALSHNGRLLFSAEGAALKVFDLRSGLNSSRTRPEISEILGIHPGPSGSAWVTDVIRTKRDGLRGELRVFPDPLRSGDSKQIGPIPWFVAAPTICGSRMLVQNGRTQRLNLYDVDGNRLADLSEFSPDQLSKMTCDGRFVTVDVNGEHKIMSFPVR